MKYVSRLFQLASVKHKKRQEKAEINRTVFTELRCDTSIIQKAPAQLDAVLNISVDLHSDKWLVPCSVCQIDTVGGHSLVHSVWYRMVSVDGSLFFFQNNRIQMKSL